MRCPAINTLAPFCHGYPVAGMWTAPSLSFSSETVPKTGMSLTPIFGMSSERVLSSGPPGFRPKLNGLTMGIAPAEVAE